MKLIGKLWEIVGLISTIVFSIVMTLFISTTNMDYGNNFSNSIDYSEMWTNKEIMVVVPHQDDEINLAGATIKRLIDNGNNVKVVFATNGDFKGLGTKRIKEAVEAVRILGVNSENVIFL
ncbi:PIG-L family deacetylase [Clostridium perfringens]|uniref:PIG-L family deacetylase n=1 Tax=Clostridium perfringens TaxID=1502 RepID=UPI00224667AF|nr:PIG-L family deacetylase [Clostridium perfringens]MCX0395632.1 PIG-L family deacetylase [Clostridium perfringens]